jgi:molecular chaperone HtpG
MTTTTTPETHKFQAEVQQVLQLVIHSLYSHKEIFLRELISNASDACDKLRFAAISNPALSQEDAELRIEISFDKDAHTLSIRDNGIGMSRDEVIENIGTIARSGTRRFLEQLSGDQRKDAQLIGQFGVGFYSAFIVADKITLTTRRAGDAADSGVRWESTGTGEYTLETLDSAARGTTVTLHLKDEELEFLQPWRLRELIAKYSDHIGFPIRMPKEAGHDEAEAKAGEEKPVLEWDMVNHASALWTRPKSELKDADYQAFYKHISHDFNDPLAWAHNRVEGSQSYTSLLFVPSKAPMDAMWSGREERKGLKLYIRRVFIMDASEQLLPAYLRFVSGVIDSDDLPLNVSREILQHNKLVAQIKSGATKRVLDLLEKIASEDHEKYQGFWNEFGNVLKEGVAEDFTNKDKLAKLLRFASTSSEDKAQSVSLDDYIGRMKPGQEAIYYITADSWLAARNSPQLEALKARGVEVLLLVDRIDEWMIGYLNEYAGKKLKSVAKGDIDIDKLADAGDSEKRKEAEKAAEGLLGKLKILLAGKVRDVRVSHRLTESPSCLVLDEHDMAAHMQRLLKQAGHDVPSQQPILEINPAHPLVQRLETETNEVRANDLGLLLLEQAQLAEGGQLDDPAAYVRRVNTLLLEGLK